MPTREETEKLRDLVSRIRTTLTDFIRASRKGEFGEVGTLPIRYYEELSKLKLEADALGENGAEFIQAVLDNNWPVEQVGEIVQSTVDMVKKAGVVEEPTSLEKVVQDLQEIQERVIGTPTPTRKGRGREEEPRPIERALGPEGERLREPKPVSTEVGMEAFPARERGMPRGGLIGGKPAGEAIAQAREQKRQEVLQEVLEAGSRLETPFQHAKRALRQADLIKAEDPSLVEGDAVVNLRATVAARELSEQERGVPAEYEPGAEGQPDWMFAGATPEALTTAAGREDLERRRAQLKAMDLRLGGYDPERQARAEGRRRATDRAVSRGYGYEGGPTYPLTEATLARIAPTPERAAFNRQFRPEQKERLQGRRARLRAVRPTVYTSPLENALRRRG